MSEISKSVLEQIKGAKIKPRPRWQFVLLSILLVIFLILAVIAGSAVMSIIMLQLFDTQWDYVSFLGDRGMPTILDVFPLAWSFLMVMVLLISVWLFEKTEHGYKVHPAWVVVGAMTFSLFFGVVLFWTKGAELLNDKLLEAVPIYEKMEAMLEMKFHLPEIGIMPGRVVKIESPTAMQIEDLRSHLWKVELRQPPHAPSKDLNRYAVGSAVFLIGEKIDGSHFVARDIRKKDLLPTGPRLLKLSEKKSDD